MSSKKIHLHLADEATRADEAAPKAEPDPAGADLELSIFRRARAPGGGEYQARDDGIWFVHGELETCISNFDAEIVQRSVRSVGTGLVVRVRVGERQQELTMSTRRLESMQWITGDLAGGVLASVPAAKARLLAAITLLSKPVEVRVVDHLGWVRDDDGRWTYAHAAGGIGEGGRVDLDVEVRESLRGIVVPADGAPCPVTLPLQVLDLAPDRITVPMTAAIVRAVLGGTRFAVHVWGATGTKKSQLAAVLQGFWGSSMASDTKFPCSWSDTGNSIEVTSHEMKDCICVVDDWLPAMTPATEVDRVVRAAGNSSGRGRMGVDAKAPRALLWSTGEAVPHKPASLMARMLTIRVEPGDVDLERLTLEQRRGRDGEHARWLFGFLRWAAPQLDELRARLDHFVSDGRRRWDSYSIHPRTVDALAQLEGAWRTLVGYVWSAGDLELTETEALVRRGQAALEEVACEQERLQFGGDPVRLFLTTLRELVRVNKIHIGASVRESQLHEDRPTVAWRCDRELLLDPGRCVQAVQDQLAAEGGALDLSEHHLGRLLRESRILVRVDARGAKLRYAVRVTVAGERRRVWALRPDALHLRESEPGGPSPG